MSSTNVSVSGSTNKALLSGDCISWKQVEAGSPCDPTFLRHDQRPLRPPQVGEVFVQIRACSLNAIDARICLGQIPSVTTPPVVPCSDFAGVVVGAAPDTPFTRGDKVFGYCPNRWGGKRAVASASMSRTAAKALDAVGGALSDFMICPAENLALMPKDMDFHCAAALPTTGMTCIDILDQLPNQLHYSVAIIGASGGVGTMLIQLCKARGYRVYAITSEKNFDKCFELGAYDCIDYQREPWNAKLTPANGREPFIHAVLDVAPEAEPENWQMSKTVLAKSGVFVSLNWDNQEEQESKSASLASYWQSAYRSVLSSFWFKYITMVPTKDKLKQLATFVDDGHCDPVIDTVYCFGHTHDAFEKLMTKRTVGKLVVSWQEEDYARQLHHGFALAAKVPLPKQAPAPRRRGRPVQTKTGLDGSSEMPYHASDEMPGGHMPDMPEYDDEDNFAPSAFDHDTKTYTASTLEQPEVPLPKYDIRMLHREAAVNPRPAVRLPEPVAAKPFYYNGVRDPTAVADDVHKTNNRSRKSSFQSAVNSSVKNYAENSAENYAEEKSARIERTGTNETNTVVGKVVESPTAGFDDIRDSHF